MINHLIKLIALFSLTYSISSFALYPDTSNFTEVPEIQLDGLQNYVGKQISAYYVSAVKGFYAGKPTVIEVLEGPQSFDIGTDGKATISKLKVDKDDLRNKSCNAIIFFVHEKTATKDTYFPVNKNGKIIVDGRDRTFTTLLPDVTSYNESNVELTKWVFTADIKTQGSENDPHAHFTIGGDL